MNAVSFPPFEAGSVSAPPVERAAPASSGPASLAIAVPAFVAGFSSSFVLEWHDPSTNQLISQLPMRNVLASIAEIGGPNHAPSIGKIVDSSV
jgi:hypothetical protein